MSHDQKPSKVRLVSSGASAAGPGGTVAGDAGAAAGDAATAPTPATKTGLSPIVLGILFVLGCALGGAALPLLHIL